MDQSKQNFNVQKILVIVSILLFGIKIFAWYLTGSVAILTDALESIVNVFTAFVGLYSLYVSSLPRDANHPYGHGKVEFLSAAVEGTLIIVAGFFIIVESLYHLKNPHTLAKLDWGILLILFTALVNFGLGYMATKRGQKHQSLALIASGRHLQSDTYSTMGIIVGLILLYFTKFNWIDSFVAFIFAIAIIYTGYKILRSSIAGIMDEADNVLLQKVVETLNANRRENWVDMHNLRIIKYGGVLHLDCHLTVPWYLNVYEAHHEVKALEDLVKNRFGMQVELFVHTDACLDFSCKICIKQHCHVRKFIFEESILWTVENISANRKHRIEIKDISSKI